MPNLFIGQAVGFIVYDDLIMPNHLDQHLGYEYAKIHNSNYVP